MCITTFNVILYTEQIIGPILTRGQQCALKLLNLAYIDQRDQRKESAINYFLSVIILTFRRFTVLRPEGRVLHSYFSDMVLTFRIPSSATKLRNMTAT